MLVAIKDDVVPEGLEREAVLTAADGADICHEAEDKGEDIESGKGDCACEEEIALRSVFAALVPVTTCPVSDFVVGRKPTSTDMSGVNLR